MASRLFVNECGSALAGARVRVETCYNFCARAREVCPWHGIEALLHVLVRLFGHELVEFVLLGELFFRHRADCNHVADGGDFGASHSDVDAFFATVGRDGGGSGASTPRVRLRDLSLRILRHAVTLQIHTGFGWQTGEISPPLC